MKDLNEEIDPISHWRDHFQDARDHEPVLEWNYAVKGWLRRAETSILYGPSNCGKSALVCHLGSSIVTGGTFFGAPVTRGIVVHVASEAPGSVLDRMQAYDIHDAANAPYMVRTSRLDLSDDGAVADFRVHLDEISQELGEEVVLVVFDTLARSIGHLDENSSGDMTRVAEAVEQIARAINAHVMLVHHTGKDVERGGRGSSALRGAVDTEICLKPSKSGAVLVAQDKQRTMPKTAHVSFKTESFLLGKDEDGEDRTTVRAIELSGPPEETSSGSGKTPDHRMTAVLTALHIRRSRPETSARSFRTGELVADLPPSIFDGVAPANRNRTLTRILEMLANTENPEIEKRRDSWFLVQHATEKPRVG